MGTYWKGNRIIEFEEEGVKFILTEELDNLHVKRETLDAPDDYEGRPVICVDLFVNNEKQELKNLGEIDLTLIVYYTEDDLDRARTAGRVKPHIIIDSMQVPDKKLFYRKVSGSKKWLGYMMAKMNSKTGDPLIGVGP